MPCILLLDTSGFQTKCLWIEDDKEPEAIVLDSGNAHAKQIIPALDQLKQVVAPRPFQPDAISVVNGPGSYTGLRIALSVAKGICYSQRIPLLLLSNLEILARASEWYGRKALLVTKKAREAEYFCAAYGQDRKHILEPQLMHQATLEALIGSQEFHQVLENEEDKWGSAPFEVVNPGNEVLQVACLEAFEAKDFSDLFLSEPFYLKNVHINKINKL